jgi:hypothetical protein
MVNSVNISYIGFGIISYISRNINFKVSDNHYNNEDGGEGYSASQLKKGGYSAKDIYTASQFTIADLKTAKYNVKDLLSAGYKEDQIIYGNWSSVLNLTKPYYWGARTINNPDQGAWGYRFKGDPEGGFTPEEIDTAKSS